MFKDFLKVLKNNKYKYLLITQIFSSITINMLIFLVLIKLFEETGSTIATSFMWIIYAIPVLLVGPIAAALVDIFDRRKVLIITNILQFLTIVFYAIFLEKRTFVSYIVIFVYSFFNQFYVPSEAAALPSVVNKEFLPHANGVFFLTAQASLVIGAVIATLLHELFGFRAALLLCSVFLIIAFLSIYMLPKLKPKITLKENNLEKKFIEFFKRLIEGYVFIKNNKRVLLPAILLIGVQVIVAVIMVNLPSISTELVLIKPSLSGLVIVAPTAFGAVLGTLIVSSFVSKGIRKRIIIERSLLVFAIALALASLILPIVPSYLKIWFSLILFMCSGASFVGILVPSLTIMQQATPGGYLGRVFGNFWFLTTLSTILPVIFSGAVTDLFGIKFLFLILSIICLITLLGSIYLRKILIKSL